MVGLFGTCANSTWRTSFIEKFEKEGIEYFNPQVPDGEWKPEMAENEAMHLQNDDIILFPVLSESNGFASLAEIGFALYNVDKSNPYRYLIVYVAEKNFDSGDIKINKENRNARSLVIEHLKKIKNYRLIVVNSLEEMLTQTIRVHQAIEAMHKIKIAAAELNQQLQELNDELD